MKKAIFKTFIAVALFIGTILYLAACAQFAENLPQTQEEKYLTSRLIFNGLLEDYVAQKRAADPELKARWGKEIDPWFERAAVALNLWGLAISGQDRPGKFELDYNKIKNELMVALFRELSSDRR